MRNDTRIIHILIGLLLGLGQALGAVRAATMSESDTRRMLDSLSTIPTGQLAADGEKSFLAGDNDRALGIFTVVCRRYDASAPREMQSVYANAFDRYGNILYRRGAFALAMDSYLQARRIAEDNGLDEELARVLVRIGNIYASCGEYNTAITFYDRALAIPALEADERLESMALNNTFASYFLSGNKTKARDYLDLYRQKGGDTEKNPRLKFDLLLAEGMLSMRDNDNNTAGTLLRQALDCARANNLPPLCEGSVRSCMGEYFENAGMLDSALFSLREARKIAESVGNGRLVVESLRDMAQFFDRRQMRDSALEYRSRYLNLADTISYQEEVNKLQNSRMLYELGKSESAIRSLNSEKQAQRNVILVIACAVVVFAILIVVLVIQNRKLKRAWTDLYERNARQLQEDIADKQEDIRELQRKSIVNSQTQDKIAADILNYMENTDDYCLPDFSLERLAGAIGSNPRYVSEVVNVVFQKNFRAMLNDYRIRKAMLRLQDVDNYGNYTIKAISESVGYKSQATFISVFTKITGLKPGIYQKLAKANS